MPPVEVATEARSVELQEQCGIHEGFLIRLVLISEGNHGRKSFSGRAIGVQ